MPLLKSYKSIVLLLLLFIAWAFHFSYPVYYSLALSQIKSEQREKVRAPLREEIRTFRLSRDQYEQYSEDGGKELEISDKRYDIVTAVHKGDSVLCITIHDKKESRLHQDYSSLMKHNRREMPRPVSFWWCTIAQAPQAFIKAIPSLPKRHYTNMTSQPLLAGIFSKVPRPPRRVFPVL